MMFNLFRLFVFASFVDAEDTDLRLYDHIVNIEILVLNSFLFTGAYNSVPLLVKKAPP